MSMCMEMEKKILRQKSIIINRVTEARDQLHELTTCLD